MAPIERFLAIQAASGILLLLSATVALVWANSPWRESYSALWRTPIDARSGALSFGRDLHWWINDGLMVIFFFVVGLEIRREIHQGALSTLRRAALPLAAALGALARIHRVYSVAGLAGQRSPHRRDSCDEYDRVRPHTSLG